LAHPDQTESLDIFLMSNHLFSLGDGSSEYLTDSQLQALEAALKEDLAPEYRQRIEIMLLTDAGRTQAQICRQVGCSPLTARHWMMMAKTSQAHLWQEQPIGRPKIVSDRYYQRLLEVVQTSPQEFGYGFSRWTGEWLSKHLYGELEIKVSARHVNRMLKDYADETHKQLSPISMECSAILIDDLYPNRTAS
jgi:transposase